MPECNERKECLHYDKNRFLCNSQHANIVICEFYKNKKKQIIKEVAEYWKEKLKDNSLKMFIKLWFFQAFNDFYNEFEEIYDRALLLI